MRRASLIAAGMLALIAPIASAQKSNTQGFMANVHLLGAGLTRPEGEGEKNDAESGSGIGARLGWGFSPNFTIFVGVDAAEMKFKSDTAGPDKHYGLVHFDLGATYYFANPNRKLIPYIEVAASGRSIVIESDVTGVGDYLQNGGAYTFGAGINYYFARPVALSAGLTLSVGRFENAEFGGGEVPGTEGDAVSSRLKVGLAFFPMKR